MIPALTRHRGPYILMVVRPGKKPGCFSNEWLPGLLKAADVEEEAACLLADTRDQILRISVWSEKEGRFVTTITPGATL